MTSSVDPKSFTKNLTDKALELAADISPHQPDVTPYNQNATAAKKAIEKDAHLHSQPSEKPDLSQAHAPSFFNWTKNQEYQADHPENYEKHSTLESIKDTAKSTFESAKDTAKSALESAKDTTQSIGKDIPHESQAPSFFNWGKSQEYQADHPENYGKHSTLESAKDTAKSTLESIKDTAKSIAGDIPHESHAPSFFNWGKSQEYQADHPEEYERHSALESAKNTAKSTFESAKDATKSIADIPHEAQAPSFFNWGKSQDYQADHPENYERHSTLESAKDAARSTFESAKDTAKSTLESAKDTAKDVMNQNTVPQSEQTASEILSQERAPSFFNWGKSQEYQADHPQNYARENLPENKHQNISEKIGGAIKSVMDSTIDAMHLHRHDRPTPPSQFGNNESH